MKYDRVTCVIEGEARVMETKFKSEWAMQKAVDRLAELEDKIEIGELVYKKEIAREIIEHLEDKGLLNMEPWAIRELKKEYGIESEEQ